MQVYSENSGGVAERSEIDYMGVDSPGVRIILPERPWFVEIDDTWVP